MSVFRAYRETAQKLVDGAEVVVGDLLEPTIVYRVVTGCWRVYFGMSVTAGYLESERDHGSSRSGTWSQRSGQHVPRAVSQMSIQNTTPSLSSGRIGSALMFVLIHQ